MEPSAAQVTADHQDERQRRSYAWALDTYGPSKVRSRRYQAIRGLEEFLELCQTQGLSLEDISTVAAYVYARPAGETRVEIGDVILSLGILAENLGLSMDGCFTNTLTRVKGLDPEACRLKDDEKVKAGLI